MSTTSLQANTTENSFIFNKQSEKKKTPDANLQKGFFIVAPRPGLEPGTYGLTENKACQITK